MMNIILCESDIVSYLEYYNLKVQFSENYFQAYLTKVSNFQAFAAKRRAYIETVMIVILFVLRDFFILFHKSFECYFIYII